MCILCGERNVDIRRFEVLLPSTISLVPTYAESATALHSAEGRSGPDKDRPHSRRSESENWTYGSSSISRVSRALARFCLHC